MGRLTTRLADLEKRQPKPRAMLGAIEEHCIGGWGKVRGGERCSEHEECAFRSTPISAAVRRVIMFDWHEGIEEPFNE